MRWEGFNPTEGNGKECELSQANCRGHRWNLESKSPLGAPGAGELSRELDNQLELPGSKAGRRRQPLQETKK